MNENGRASKRAREREREKRGRGTSNDVCVEVNKPSRSCPEDDLANFLAPSFVFACMLQEIHEIPREASPIWLVGTRTSHPKSETHGNLAAMAKKLWKEKFHRKSWDEGWAHDL